MTTMNDTATKVRQDSTWKQLETKRWGMLQYREEDVITFPFGLLGFEHLHQWALFVAQDHPPFQWMVSIEDPDVAFVVVDPLLICPDYAPKVSRRELEHLQVESLDDLRLLSIVTLGRKPEDATINLSGPLFINVKKKIGKQVVLLSSQYPTKFPILKKQQS